MKRILAVIGMLGSLLLVPFGTLTLAVEHGGAPLGAEHPGREINARTVKAAIRDHVKAAAKAHKGILIVHDDKLGKDWRLKLDKVHDPVRTFEKDGRTVFFACSDFKSTDSPDILDIDFWMVERNGKLEVIDTRIHKVNGEARYTYEGTEIKELR